ncbi:hypothetical protein ACFQY7_18640 [Actinomadura luteofluorescens]|uniref:Uncharacterized protein n=1 Tax=Actinomadura luteofluorescens TaxID=46163 RepID=A0A7Y9EPM4_9ACTN|nr:hypothetical protein [Actinomadura luteofluorescens]NYD51611.1 hypothetical protein [Actinomadura luteofluorescens]
MSLYITTVGTAITTLLGVFVGGAITHRSQQQRWSRDRQAEACALILRESSSVLIELGKLDARDLPVLDDGVRVPTPID